MSINPLNEISAVYVKEVLEPQLGKKASRPAPTKKVEKGKDDAESSAKRIRQAVYDIRYRARREDVKLDQAYNQYMSHTTMTGPEKTAVKEKLGLISGSGAVSEEVDAKKGKFKVRVTDKTTGKSYVRYATREKITQLRANPNIKSVEMTSYGQPYEGEKTKGSYTAKAKAGKGLDPVGREDNDPDNDGVPISRDKNDQYIMKRRKAIGKVIASKKTSVDEEFSNWREDLVEVMGKVEQPKMVTGKGKKTTKIVINPTLPEAVKNLGGELVEMTEITNEESSSDRVSKFGNRLKDLQARSAATDAAAKEDLKKLKKSANDFVAAGDRLANEEVEIDEKVVNPYAVGMAAAMKSTGDKPPLKKSTITKAHKIAKKVEATEEVMQPSSTQKPNQAQNTQQQNKPTPEDRRLAAIQKTQLAAKLKQVQRGVPLSASYDPEGEVIDERRIEDKVAGTPRKPRDRAFELVAKSMGAGRMGVQPRGKKKEPGKKPPAAGEYGSERRSPAQQLAAKRAAERRSAEMQSSRFD
jgi:hypothetical protein